MDILEALRKRNTARSFNGEPVKPEILERILDSGRLAPSAKNRQAWRFIAVTQQESKNALKNACFGDDRVSAAACIVAACTTNIIYTMPNGQLSYPLDLAFAVSYMTIQATYEGIASAILGTYNEADVKAILTAPYSMKIVLLLALGHSDDKTLHKDRLPKDRIITYESW